MTTKPDGSRSLRPILNDVLTTISHGATPFISTFLLIHLSAPAIANLGGSGLASQTLLLGREYYQTPYGEIALLFAPLTAHVVASSLKRLISSNKTQSPRPISSPMTMAGYALSLLWIPLHVRLHRLIPQISSPPIHSVGPAELDMEFVKYGLRTWPFRSGLLYAGLMGAVVVHVSEAMGLLPWMKGVVGRLKSDMNRRKVIGFLGVALPVVAGLITMGREPSMVFPSMAERYHAVFTHMKLFSI